MIAPRDYEHHAVDESTDSVTAICLAVVDPDVRAVTAAAAAAGGVANQLSVHRKTRSQSNDRSCGESYSAVCDGAVERRCMQTIRRNALVEWK